MCFLLGILWRLLSTQWGKQLRKQSERERQTKLEKQREREREKWKLLRTV